MTPSVRTYGQWCPVAAGLDVLGDRWVLLICRELLMGDRRFTDLRAALPGIAPNLLTERLRALQAAGLVELVELPPPAARTVYHLTEEGERVAPVLRSLARFGVRHLDDEPGPTLDARRAAHALLLPWRRPVDADLRLRLVLGPDDEIDVVLAGRSARVTRPSGEADVTLTTTAAALAAARRSPEPLDASVRGSASDRRLALDAFGLTLAKASRSARVST